MKTILVTGVTGFIGKHLLEGLKQDLLFASDQVVLLSSTGVKGYPTVVHKNYRVSKNDFLALGIDQVDIIIHAGAYTPKSGDDGFKLSECNGNIYSLQSLIEALPGKPEKFIFLSTLDVYKNIPGQVISENTQTEPVTLYGWSKLYGEKMTEAWAIANKINYQLLRLGHVYGPGEEAYQKIIPVIIRRLLKKQPIQIWGSGKEIRSFIFIKDIIAAILQAVHLKENIGVVNLVGAQRISIKELVETLIEISGMDDTLIETVPIQQQGRDFLFDNTKMKQLLFSGETALRQGLIEEWEYMKEFYRHENIL